MKIFSNQFSQNIPKFINKYENNKQVSYGQSMENLPVQNTIGISQVNTNLPVSYTKISEIPIPGLNQNASVFKLANGQKVVILPKKGPTYIKTTYNVGSLNEKDSQRGISHYIEHNLFNGSKNLLPGEYNKQVSQMGGYTNASTEMSYTDYYLNMQLLEDDSLEKGIKLNADMTQFPLFPEDQLKKEKEPVKSEIDMCCNNTFNIARNKNIKALFNIQSASDDIVAGTTDNINALTKENVLDYYNTWYTPDNAVTVITGDVYVNETINLVSKYYNKKNDYSKINQRQYEPIKYIDKSVRQDTISPKENSAFIQMGFVIPEGTSNKELSDIDMLLCNLLSSNSRLSKALDKYGISVEYSLDKLQNKPDSAKALLFNCTSDEKEVEEVLKILYQEITYIANNPPKEEELNQNKKALIQNINERCQSSECLNDDLTKLILDNNNPNFYQEKINNISSATPLDISNTAKKFLDLNKTSVCVIHSKDANTETINKNYNDSLNTSKPVSFGAHQSPVDTIKQEINSIQEYTLQNNIKTEILQGSPNSRSTVSIEFNNENINDVSSVNFDVLEVLLNRGNAFKSNEEMQDFLNKNDIYATSQTSQNDISFTYSFYPDNLQNVLSVFKESLLNPNFSQEEFERAKDIVKKEILNRNPRANDQAIKNILGKNKYFDRDKENLLSEVDKLTLDDVKNLYSRIMSNAQVKASAILPVNEYPQITNILNTELSSGLPVFNPVSTSHPDNYFIYKPNDKEQIYTQAIENSQADIGQFYTYKRSDNIEDKVKIELLNNILGNGMSSRLFQDLRETQKLAYSVRSVREDINDTATIQLNILTTTDSDNPNEGSPENVIKALEGFKRNVNLLKTQNVSEEELNRVKSNLKFSILNSLELNSDKLIQFKSDIKSPYGKNFILEYMNAIDKVTPDDIRAAANYVFANPPITTIDASQKTLDALNLNSSNQ